MGAHLADLDLPAPTGALLTRFGFQPETFARLRAELRAGAFTPQRNRTAATVEPPSPGDVLPWPEGAGRAELEALGNEALRRGQVGTLILNGGMATRFGGRVKGVVEVVDGHSFLDLRLTSITAAPGPVTVFLMNSFATDGATREHLAEHHNFGLPPTRLHCLNQRISLRLHPDGEVFRDHSGVPSPYAPGHGDVFEVLAESEAFGRFVEGGGRYVVFANVDNLGATLSPVVLGAHIRGARAVTVEVADRLPGDKGGAPVRVGSHLEILEGFRFPESFDFERLRVFNTNTLVSNVEAVRGDYPLTWFRADKEVEGHPVVQFERLMGEVTSFVDATFFAVPRSGADNRFMPVKTPADLDTLANEVRARFPGRLGSPG